MCVQRWEELYIAAFEDYWPQSPRTKTYRLWNKGLAAVLTFPSCSQWLLCGVEIVLLAPARGFPVVTRADIHSHVQPRNTEKLCSVE